MIKLSAALIFPIVMLAGDAQLLDVGGPLPVTLSGAATATNFTINAGGTWASWVFQPPEAVTMTTFLFRYGVRTGTPVQHRISLQGVNTSGNPDTTIVVCAAFTPPADTTWNNTVQAITFSSNCAGGSPTTASLTRGAFYSIVVEPCPNAAAPCSGAATPDGSNNSTFTTDWANIASPARQSFPYADTTANSGSTWTKLGNQPIFGYRSASKSYGVPLQNIQTSSISSGSEQGVSFTLPSTWCTTFQVLGVRFAMNTPAAAKSMKVVLYNGTTVQQSVTYDTDFMKSNGTNNTAELYFSDSNLVTLTCGSLYRVKFSPQDASNNFGLMQFNLAAAGDRTAFAGGTIFAYATRTSCGAPCDSTSTAWAADDSTTRPYVSLILAALTNAAGDGTVSFGYAQ
jgi:hypothetical protein